jgi:5-methylcytosine-specific restriction endonuclease McrA
MPARRCLDCQYPIFSGSRCDNCKRLWKARRDAEAPIAKALVAAASVCAKCGKPGTSKDPLTADHKNVPFIRGGKLTPNNSQVLHRTCNTRKGTRASA